MLVSDLPASAVEIAEGVWSDEAARLRYYLDPVDPTLLVFRPWTEAEVAAWNEEAALEGQNEAVARSDAAAQVDALLALIGPKVSEATAGEDSINEFLSIDNPTINGNPARHIKILARLLRLIVKALIPALRLISGRLESVSTGN